MKRKKTKTEKRQARLARLMRKTPEQQLITLRQLWPYEIPGYAREALDPMVLAAWTPREKWACAHKASFVSSQSSQDAFSISDKQMRQLSLNILDAMGEAFSCHTGEWTVGRDRIVMELLAKWIHRCFVYEVEDQDVGYDRSTVARDTGRTASLSEIDTLGQWMRMATGENRATYISGMGMSARIWEEEVRDRLEEHMNAFSDNYAIHHTQLNLGEDGIDCDTLAEIRIAAEDIHGCGIGGLGMEELNQDSNWGYKGWGYIGRLEKQSIQDFLRQVDLAILNEYRALDPLIEVAWLERNTANADGHRSLHRL